MDKPIISTWGIGPSYRNRVKSHITECLNSGYKDIMKYVIITDFVEDFDEFRKSNDVIIGVFDINELRKEYEWSFDYEPIPSSKDNEKNYGVEYRQHLSNGRAFSYGLHRFSFLKLAELGYHKILFMDSDNKIEYQRIGNEMTEEEFWDEFNTPINSMKGCVKETIKTEYLDSSKIIRFHNAAAMGYEQSLVSLQVSTLIFDKLNKKYNLNKYPLIKTLEITEGPFRYYNLESPQKVMDVFKVWNDAMEIVLTDRYLYNTNQCGGYSLCDYIPVGVSNLYSNVKVLNFPNKIYTRQIYFEDRYFLPPAIPGIGGSFEVTESVEEFLEKNKEYKERISWPHREIVR